MTGEMSNANMSSAQNTSHQESVLIRRNKSKNFLEYYEQQCALNDTIPVPAIVKNISVNVIDMNADTLHDDDWGPILEALRVNRKIEFLGIRSYYGIPGYSGKIGKVPGIYSNSTLVSQIIEVVAEFLECNPVIKTLDLQCIPLSASEINILRLGLKKNKSLTNLSLECCGIGDLAIIHLCRTLKHYARSLDLLNLSDCHVKQEGASALAELLKYQNDRRHQEAWRHSLRGGVHTPTKTTSPSGRIGAGLQRLTLNRNPEIGDVGACRLAEALQGDAEAGVRALDLQHCGLTDRAVLAFLVLARSNPALEIVDARLNPAASSQLVHSLIETLLQKVTSDQHEQASAAAPLRWMCCSSNHRSPTSHTVPPPPAQGPSPHGAKAKVRWSPQAVASSGRRISESCASKAAAVAADGGSALSRERLNTWAPSGSIRSRGSCPPSHQPGTLAMFDAFSVLKTRIDRSSAGGRGLFQRSAKRHSTSKLDQLSRKHRLAGRASFSDTETAATTSTSSSSVTSDDEVQDVTRQSSGRHKAEGGSGGRASRWRTGGGNRVSRPRSEERLRDLAETEDARRWKARGGGRLKLGDLEFELLQARTNLQREKAARCESEKRAMELEVSMKRLQSQVDQLQEATRYNILDDNNVLTAIEEAFERFGRFLDMLKALGYEDLIRRGGFNPNVSLLSGFKDMRQSRPNNTSRLDSTAVDSTGLGPSLVTGPSRPGPSSAVDGSVATSRLAGDLGSPASAGGDPWYSHPPTRQAARASGVSPPLVNGLSPIGHGNPPTWEPSYEQAAGQQRYTLPMAQKQPPHPPAKAGNSVTSVKRRSVVSPDAHLREVVGKLASDVVKQQEYKLPSQPRAKKRSPRQHQHQHSSRLQRGADPAATSTTSPASAPTLASSSPHHQRPPAARRSLTAQLASLDVSESGHTGSNGAGGQRDANHHNTGSDYATSNNRQSQRASYTSSSSSSPSDLGDIVTEEEF